MEHIFEAIQFKYSFRDYQQRALNELQAHFTDSKLHIVAAPGAGKTILALEVMLRLGKPTLILAPTVGLRQQWITRFSADFKGSEAVSISDDLTNPATLTVATYQSLYSIWRHQQSADLFTALRRVAFGTLILDEAHHLKKAWLTPIIQLQQHFPLARTVSLTATPPYDVPASSWNRYIQLCGEIDIEIPVPELVQTGDLAPHADFIYFSTPHKTQTASIREMQRASTQMFDELLHNETLIAAVCLHPAILDLQSEFILQHFDEYCILLNYLLQNKIPLPGLTLQSTHPFSMSDMSTLLTMCLFSDAKHYRLHQPFFSALRNQLNALGAIDKKRVQLQDTKELQSLLTRNQSKMESVCEIIKQESATLKESLKLVVIADLILEQALELPPGETFPHLGVIPLFLTLYHPYTASIIVLTGEIIIIPTRLENALRALCRTANIPDCAVYIEPLALRFDSAKVVFSAGYQKNAITLITELFRTTDISILIGSHAYIGEGWDAPFINTLIMASSISSFVSSNQIRGRAMRTSAIQPEKCANIWHLVCTENIGENQFALGSDFRSLARRFQAFEGLYLDANRIGIGISRYKIADNPYSQEELTQLNNTMFTHANARADTIQRWQLALPSYHYVRETPLSALAHTETLASLAPKTFPLRAWYYRLLKKDFSLFLLAKRDFVTRAIRALQQSLIHFCLLRSEVQLNFTTQDGESVYTLQHATFQEQQLFHASLRELLQPIEHPRYLFLYRKHYYAVPKILAQTKERALFFTRRLNVRRLIYTHTPEGRQTLLTAKLAERGFAVKWNQLAPPTSSAITTKTQIDVLQAQLHKEHFL